MKKLTALVLLLALAVSLLSGCGEKAPKSMTFKEFDEKWRRADFDKFLADPSEFIDDLKAVNSQSGLSEDQLAEFNGWDVVHEYTSETGASTERILKKDCVLFNKPLEYGATLYISGKTSKMSLFLSVEYESGDVQADLKFANALYSCLVTKYGDPSKIEIDDRAIDEPKLLRILNGSDRLEGVSVSFESAYLSLFAFKHTDGHYSSSVTIHAYPDIPDEE